MLSRRLAVGVCLTPPRGRGWALCDTRLRSAERGNQAAEGQPALPVHGPEACGVLEVETPHNPLGVRRILPPTPPRPPRTCGAPAAGRGGSALCSFLPSFLDWAPRLGDIAPEHGRDIGYGRDHPKTRPISHVMTPK